MADGFSITVLISGGGTTLQNLIEWRRRGDLTVEIGQVISSSEQAKGNQFANEANIPLLVLPRQQFPKPKQLSERLFEASRESGADLVVAAGFLRRLVIPPDFENRVINIHPSLIPAFCGQGFYGMRVHESVIEYGCKLSGCTVHFVDNQYDHGPIIAQQTVDVTPEDTPQSLQQRVFAEECRIYPSVIEQIAQGRIQVEGRTVHIRE